MSDVFSGDARVVSETDDWAAVFKPHGMPSAPLADGEEGTLLSWFLCERPEARAVLGRKPVERGLLHRLDTDTAGLVLVAKRQSAYDALLAAQGAGLFAKRYAAFSTSERDTVWGFPPRDSNEGLVRNAPMGGSVVSGIQIQSKFRPYGKGSRMVRPLFPGDRGYVACRDEYTTEVESVVGPGETGYYRVIASLVRGYRHQIRAHLAAIGLPIAGDALYRPEDGEKTDANGLPLQLHAFSIAFPDPLTGSPISVSLPLPDRTSR
jgi:23S rRNA pseudouridine1911/1915/1917 synthase